MDNLNNLEKVAYWWVKIACYGALVMPFIFLPWTIYPYIFGKTVFLVAILMTALPWYIFLIARRPEYRPKRSLIIYGLVAYFIAMLLATVFSYDFSRSFWSYPERMTGFYWLLHYLLFFFMAAGIFRGWNEWKRILTFSVGVSVALSFIAFIQRISPETVLQNTGARTGAFMNNPIFFAAYLVISLFFTVLLLQKSQVLWQKITWGVILAIQFLAFLFAESRGAMVGVFLAAFVYLLLFGLLNKNKKIKKIILIALLIIILSSIGFWFVKGQDWVGHIPGVKRFHNISFTGGTVETRMIAWNIAWKGFLEKPIFGWGPENYFYAFNKHYNPKSLQFSFYETWFDHAHNQMFDQLNNTGIVGALSYVALFALIIIELSRMYQRKKIDLVVFCTSIAILIGYFVQNLFIFDQPSVLIMFYFCLAWWQSSATEGAEKGKVWIKGSGAAISLLGIAGIISMSLLYLFTLRPAFASTWVRTGVIYAQQDIEASADAFEKGVTMKHQYPDMVPLYYAREIAQFSRMGPEPNDRLKELLQRSYDVLNGVEKRHEANIYIDYLLSLIQMELGKSDPAYYDQALVHIEDALKYSPNRQQLRFVKGKVLLLQEKYDEAVDYYKGTIDLDPEVAESWWNLGIAYYQAGQAQESLDAFEKARELGNYPKNIQEAAALIELYATYRDFDKLVEIYNFTIDNIAPKNPRLYAGLAAVYLEMGHYDLARLHANIAYELDPTLKEDTQNFLLLIDLEEQKAQSATATME